jgi:outer membrane protein assembly factor BamA
MAIYKQDLFENCNAHKIISFIVMKYGILSLLILANLITYGQKRWAVKVLHEDSIVLAEKHRALFLRDSSGAQLLMVDFLRNLKTKGYVGASIDSSYFQTDTFFLKIFAGQRIGGVKLLNGNLTESDVVRYSLNKYINKEEIIPVDRLEKIKELVIKECENSGYPFASCRIDSFVSNGSLFTARIYIEKNALIEWDTLSKETTARLRVVFLKNYLGIKAGKPYKESTAQKIDARLNLLPYAEPIKKSEIEILNDRAKPLLYLKDRKVNQFDLLIGLLPGSSGQRVLITGKAQLHLVSAFGFGEEFKVKWEKLQPKTQTLDVHLIYPFMFGLPIGLNAKFELFKKDTAFLNLNGDYGIQFQLEGNDYVKGSYKNQSTIILTTDTAFVRTNRKLPPNLDLAINQFALELFLQRLNYRFNPTSGYQLKGSVSFGLKNIRRNNQILNMYDGSTNNSFGFLYDSIKQKTFIMQVDLVIDKFWKVSKRQTIRTMFEGAYQFNQTITDNELYRIGGTSSLRGFDDRSVLSPYYLIANLEYRYLISKNAFFFTFINAALVKEYRSFRNRPFDFPYGFGAGAAIETRIGMFALSYAMGTRQDEKISFRSAKIHFGYINYF